MKLHHKQYSSGGHPLLILHGLFGSLSNWGWQSNKLSSDYAVTGLDLRNHGASPHADSMDYRSMAQDVLEFMDEHELASAHVLGHSMGGKVAMQLALDHPQKVDRLVVADIAPVPYQGDHDQIFAGLQAVDLQGINTRNEADGQLAVHVDDEQVRQFLLTNLLRTGEGRYEWRINLEALVASYDQLRQAPAGTSTFDKDTLFVRGALSNYITDQHRDAIAERFPAARITTIEQVGHWLHAEKPQTFYRIVSDFLAGKE